VLLAIYGPPHWRRFFDAAIELLRSLRKAQARSIPADGPVVATLFRESIEQAEASLEVEPSTRGTVRDFRRLLLELASLFNSSCSE
jgi:hypothetical protein